MDEKLEKLNQWAKTFYIRNYLLAVVVGITYNWMILPILSQTYLVRLIWLLWLILSGLLFPITRMAIISRYLIGKGELSIEQQYSGIYDWRYRIVRVIVSIMLFLFTPILSFIFLNIKVKRVGREIKFDLSFRLKHPKK
jgi:hypothetical protein